MDVYLLDKVLGICEENVEISILNRTLICFVF